MKRSHQKNYDTLDSFIDIQRDTMFSQPKSLGFARMTFSKSELAPYWNYALVNTVLNDREILSIEDALLSMKRKPMIYFETRAELDPLKEDLKRRGYRLHNEDSWMFYEDSNLIDVRGFDSIKMVDSIEDLDVWIKTIDHCYVKSDPKNPYGELGLYLELATKAWIENHALGKFEYYMAFKDSKPVAVATLTHHNSLGYISNVGSLPEVRGQGYGKLITLYCVHRSMQNGNKETFLGTEEGTYPNDFYKRLGFKTRFTASGYVKDVG